MALAAFSEPSEKSNYSSRVQPGGGAERQPETALGKEFRNRAHATASTEQTKEEVYLREGGGCRFLAEE